MSKVEIIEINSVLEDIDADIVSEMLNISFQKSLLY